MAALDIIKNVLSENLDIEKEKINEDSTMDSLGVDSLDMVELICNLEDEMDIDFGEPENLHTVGDVAKYAEELAGK